MTAVSGSPSVAISLEGKQFLTDSWTEVISASTWSSAAVKLATTTPVRYRYYAIKFICTTAPAWPSTVQFKQWFVSPDVTVNSLTDGTATFTAGALSGATTIAASGRITGTGGMTITGAATNINATSNFATNIGTGTTNAAVTIGNSANTIALVAPTTTTGVLTVTGGLNFASGSTVFWAKGGTPTAVATGTDSPATAGDRYWSEIELPHNATLTGLSYLVGSVGGTDSVQVNLFNSSGTLVATSKKTGAAHGDIVGTAAELQSVAFTTTYAAVAGKYFASVQFNGTTAKFRTYLIPGSKFIAGTAAGTYDTAAASITPGSTFTAGKGPIIATY
jgi:hypothetical protein